MSPISSEDDYPIQSEEPAGESPETGNVPGFWSSRRTLMKAAALGAGVAAGAWRFRPLEAFAHNISDFQCTANDVRIIGPGQVLNEPCECTGTFTAQVQFTVENNAAAERFCITLHLCPTTLPNGSIFNPGDVVLQGTVPGKTTQTMLATIPNFPCGAGLICFGTAGSLPDGGFDKGERCPAGQCCTTVTWNVRPNDECPVPVGREISSKCRHQQICIQGRGAVTLDCDTSASGVQTSCPVPCGSTTTLRLCISNGPAPFHFVLRDAAGNVVGDRTSSNLCEDFTVGPVTATTSFTGTVTDATGCAKSASATLTVAPITPVLNVGGLDNCNGVLTFSTSVPGFSGCSLAYTIDGSPAANSSTDTLLVRVNADGTLDYRNLDGACHTIGVTATCGSCTGTATRTVRQACVQTTTPCTP